MENFDVYIRALLERFAYYFYVVQLDKGVHCACVSVSTKQAEPFCERCLGTGYKIVIRKFRGVSQNAVVAFANISQIQSQKLTAPVYFIDKNYPVYKDDIIVDRGDSYVVQNVDIKKSDNRNYVYQKVVTSPKKGHEQWFLGQVSKITKGK